MALHYAKIPQHLHDRPRGEHLWAQADRASVALTYAQDGNSFWEPHVHLTNGHREGITAGEFPLLPYAASKLYNAWGFNESLHRGMVLLLSVLGWVFGFLLARKWIAKPGWTVAAVVTFIISPNLIFYGASFLPDTVAMSFLLVSMYALLGRQPLNWLQWIMFSLFLMLSALIKISAILPAMAILLAWLLTEGRSEMKTWRSKLLLAVAVAVPTAVVMAWVLFARKVTEEGDVFVFLLEPLPPKSFGEWASGVGKWLTYLHYYYPPFTWIVLGAGTLVGVFFWKRSRPFLLLAAILCYLSYFLFFFLLFDKSPTHHYYTVPFQVGILLHLCWLAHLASKIRLRIWAVAALAIAGLVLTNVNAIHAGKNANARFSHDRDFSIFNDLEPQLNKLGIRYEDRVLCYDDYSFNISLYLMNRKGVTLSPHSDEKLAQAALSSCQYAVLTDTSLLALPLFGDPIGPAIGAHKSLSIHRIQSLSHD